VKNPENNLESFWNPLDLQATESVYRAWLEREGPSPEVFTWLGRAEGALGRFGDARTSLEKAEKGIEDEAVISAPALKIRWLIERARLYILDKTPYQARNLLVNAWELARKTGEDSLAIETAQLLSVSESLKSQQEWIARALEVAEKSQAEKAKHWLGSLYVAMGLKLYDLRQFDKALAAFEKSSHFSHEQGLERESLGARCLGGKVLRTLGKLEEALEVQKAVLLQLDQAGWRDGRVYEEMAEIHHTLKHEAEAQQYFELAYRELSSDAWIVDNQPVQIKRLRSLGKVKG